MGKRRRAKRNKLADSTTTLLSHLLCSKNDRKRLELNRLLELAGLKLVNSPYGVDIVRNKHNSIRGDYD